MPLLTELRAEAAADAPSAAAAAVGGNGANHKGEGASKPVLPTLLSIARELLDGSVTADTDLLEAGLDSLASTELTSRVRAELNAPLLAPGALADHPTPRALAAHVLECRPPPPTEREHPTANRAPSAEARAEAAAPKPAAPAGWPLLRELPPAPLPAAPGGATLANVVALGETTEAAPGFLGAAAAALPQVFCMHSLHGRTAQFAHLATGLRGVASVLGVEHPLLRSGAAEDERPVSLAQLAARHAGSLVHASGLSRPHMVGESFGAVLAHATATTAEALGARPRLLAMVEPTPPTRTPTPTPPQPQPQRQP